MENQFARFAQPLVKAVDAGEVCIPAPDMASEGVVTSIGALPPGALVTEAGLARLLDKCVASIKAAVIRGELPRPVKLMGKNSWTAGAIIRHMEARLEAEARKFARLNA